mgnify:FL=1
MFKDSEKELELANKQIAAQKQREVSDYLKELTKYKKKVVRLALDTLAKKGITHYTGKDDEISALLSAVPDAGALSVPTFFEDSYQSRPYELIDLDRGYLSIFAPQDGEYELIFHMEKPSPLNPYLDLRTTWKQAYPALIRDGAKTVSTAGTIARLLTAFHII